MDHELYGSHGDNYEGYFLDVTPCIVVHRYQYFGGTSLCLRVGRDCLKTACASDLRPIRLQGVSHILGIQIFETILLI
jgi:hypothetical protein